MYDYRKIVFNSLDNSFDNGYDLTEWTIEEVVQDILNYDDDVFALTEDECKIYVAEWQDMKLQEKRRY